MDGSSGRDQQGAWRSVYPEGGKLDVPRGCEQVHPRVSECTVQGKVVTGVVLAASAFALVDCDLASALSSSQNARVASQATDTSTLLHILPCKLFPWTELEIPHCDAVPTGRHMVCILPQHLVSCPLLALFLAAIKAAASKCCSTMN
jgi:hypothetical protein